MGTTETAGHSQIADELQRSAEFVPDWVTHFRDTDGRNPEALMRTLLDGKAGEETMRRVAPSGGTVIAS